MSLSATSTPASTAQTCTLSDPDGERVDIVVRSAGFDDGNAAEIHVAGRSVLPPDLVASNGRARGLCVAALRLPPRSPAALQPAVRAVRVFDVYKSSAENRLLQHFVSTQPPGTVLALAVRDEGSRHLDVLSRWLLDALGSRAVHHVGFRDSWCLVCRVGPHAFVDEQFESRFQGPAVLRTSVPSISTTPTPPTPPSPPLPSTPTPSPSAGAARARTSVDINLLSAGFEDGNCACILVDGRSVLTSAVSYTRGIHAAVIHRETGAVLQHRVFDVYRYSGFNSLLHDFLTDLERGAVVAMVVKDAAGRRLDAFSRWLIEGLGSACVRQLYFRDSWCLLGRVGARAGSAAEAFKRRSTGYATLRRRQFPLGDPPAAAEQAAEGGREEESKPRNSVAVRLYSAGFESGNHAALFVDARSVFRAGLHAAAAGPARGLNVAVLDPDHAHFTDFRSFDTYCSPADNCALRCFLKCVPQRAVVAVAVKDDASNNLDPASRQVLRDLGSSLVDSLEFRDSWCLVTRVGSPETAVEQLSKRGRPPATVDEYSFPLS